MKLHANAGLSLEFPRFGGHLDLNRGKRSWHAGFSPQRGFVDATEIQLGCVGR